MWHNISVEQLPSLKAPEIPLDHPDSHNMFQPGPEKPLLATPAFMRANVEGSVYRVDDAGAEVAGLYVLPHTREELDRLLDTIIADTVETWD